MKARLAAGAFLLVPILIFFLYLYKHALNVPFMDDLDLIATINDINDTPSNTLHILIRQQNDHRILFSRLGMLTVYLVTGEINFRYTILLGFLNLVLLAYAFYLVYTSFRRDITLFLPVVILLFSPTVYAVHLWSITSYQYTLSLAFSFISLYFLQEEKKSNWYWSLPFALCATLTNLDGLSVLPIGLFWLLMQRRYWQGLLFMALSAIWLVIYFSNFRFSNATNLSLSTASAFTIFKSFVAFIGSFAKMFSDTHAIILSTSLGILILLYFIIQFTQRAIKHIPDSHQKNSWIALMKFNLLDICFLRVMATSCMIAIGRSHVGIEDMMAIRFQIYSIAILLLFYFIIIYSVRINRPQLILVLTISCFISVFSYLKYEKAVILLKQGLKADAYNYTHNQVFLHQNSFDPPQSFFRNYKFSQFIDPNIIKAWQGISSLSNTIKVTSTKVSSHGPDIGDRHLWIDLEIQNVPKSLPYDNAFLTLQGQQNPTKCYLISIHDKSNWLNNYTSNNNSRTYSGFFPLKIPQDIYELRICWIDNNKPKSILIASHYEL